MKPFKPLGSLALALGLTLALSAASARANVYATNIKINGVLTNLSVAPGSSLVITYILNEPASAGVTVKILSGNTAVRSLSLTNGAPGTLRGLNSVTWDGKDDGGRTVPVGTYSVSITAASLGYSSWTLTTDDTNPGNYSWRPRGIAVDRNPTSPYYGRIFVGNSEDNTASGSPKPGDQLAVQKLNADGSFADDGAYSTGGIDWSSSGSAPWKIRVSDDDQVYVGAFAEGGNNAGDIYRFDGTLSSNSMVHVFAPPSDSSLGEWTGFSITGSGTNTLLWGADDRNTGSLGIKRFALTTNGTFDVTAGTQIVSAGPSSALTIGPFAVAVTEAGTIYTLQKADFQGDSKAFVLRFPAYDPSTNSGAAETQADWTAGPGTNDDYNGAYGIAVDPTGSYVAACFQGYIDLNFFDLVNGNIKLLNATNGAVVTNLDLGIAFPAGTSTGSTNHIDVECDWDAVGNLYYLDGYAFCWRAFSPPGTNQATTVAVPVVQITTASAPTITLIGVTNGIVTISFTADPTDPASAFGLFSSSSVYGPFTQVTSAVITGSGGSYQASVATNGAVQYYDVQRVATTTQAPQIQRLTLSGGKAIINFTGAANDSATAFTVLSSATVNGTWATVTNATITGSGGAFQATVNTNSPAQFYRIRR